MAELWPEPISEMLLEIDRHDGTLWAMPVVNALESQSPGSSLDFAIKVIAAQLGNLSKDRASLAERWLADLKRMVSSPTDPDTLTRASRDIWYHDLSRDEFQTAIAGLYAALASLQAKNYPGYRRETAMALAVGASGQDGRPLPDKLRYIIEFFPN
jgi:hypothetical protein